MLKNPVKNFVDNIEKKLYLSIQEKTDNVKFNLEKIFQKRAKVVQLVEYISTRNKNLNFGFKDVFLRGLAPDGGLFVPKKIKISNKSELKDLSKMPYVDL